MSEPSVGPHIEAAGCLGSIPNRSGMSILANQLLLAQLAAGATVTAFDRGSTAQVLLSEVDRQEIALAQDLERSRHLQEGMDLKLIGSILRGMLAEDQIMERTETQTAMVQIGNRYGIEPHSGGRYTLDRVIRIAEEVIERVLRMSIEQRSAPI